MAFLIPDNLKSRQDVPAGIRRVASAFQVGLDESAAVWYEPLYDPSGDKPHLVVLLPERGIVVLEALEVRSAGLLGVLRGRIRLERDGREVEVGSPLERAKRLAEVLRQRIAAEPRLAGFTVPVGAGAVFGSLAREEAESKRIPKVMSVDLCLFRPDLDAAIAGSGEAALLRAFTRMLGSPATEPIPADKEKLLRGIIQPETVIDRVANASQGAQLVIFRPSEGGDDVIRVMDRQQEAMAKSLGDGHRVIRGVAGSGKTLVLVYRARLLSRMYPSRSFLVTCYTRSLAGQLRTLLRDCPNLDVMHLDRVMSEAMRAAGLRHPGYDDGSDGERVAAAALQALQRGRGTRYRGVLLDEAQDFGTTALRFVVGLLEPGHDDLVVVADAAQNIFRRKFSWKQAGIQAQGRTRILRVNYRNTREILEFASRFLLASTALRPEEVPDPEDEAAVIPPESAQRSGPRPELEIVKDTRAEVGRAIARATEYARRSSAPRSVAVLFPGSFDSGVDRARALYDGLAATDRVFWLSDPQNKTNRDRLAEAEDPILLSTIHSAKGLEFPYVVLCGIWSDREEQEANRKLAYVGMTRATDHLAVVSRDGHPLVEDLRRAIAG